MFPVFLCHIKMSSYLKHRKKTKFLKYLQERGFGCDKSDAGFAGRNVVVPGKVGVVSSRDQV